MPTVQFRNIVKKYGSLTVIENLDLMIEDGEFIVLLGPSGCGKTTLLNILAGLLEINGGEVLIGDRDVTFLDPKDRGLAMVFQSYALYPTKTVRGNLKFGLSARRISNEEIDRRIDWAAKLLQIGHLLDRKPAQLSGGQRQRVAIGRALVKQVGVCLFDEPLSNLDAKLRTEMRMEIKKLHNQLQNTVVYVTHDQVEAMTMATKIAVMDKGVIQQLGTPDEIYDTPDNLFVADFVGSPAMNILDGVVRKENGGVVAIDERNQISFDLGEYRWKKPPEENRKIKVGFRAEHFLQVNGAAGQAGKLLKFDRPVDYFEKSGPDALAFLALPGQVVSARIDAHYAEQYRDKPTLPVLLPLSKINVFDAESGRRV
jgi:multiple sugar transport system ATP-binding protein